MGSENGAFVHLHCHSDYSLLDGCARVGRYMERLKELGQPAMALTDHGNLFGAIDFYRAAKSAGIQPIIGCEIYLVYDHKMEDRPKKEKNRTDDIGDLPEDQAPRPEDFPRYQIHHKTILAKNFEGYQNLCKLISEAHVEGFYRRPRVDLERLAKYSKGLIGLSGCVNGVASQYLIYDDFEKAREATATFIDIFGKENYFIELQDHGMPVQRRISKGLLKLAREFELKPVCANDVHYVYKDDAKPHDALLCIQTGKILSDEKRMRYPCQEFYLKSRAQMAEIFREVPESVDNTLAVAEMTSDLEIPFGENHYPIFEIPAEPARDKTSEDFDRVLDVYVREKNKVLAQGGEEANFTLSEEERTKLKEHGLYLMELCKKGLQERYGVDYDHPDAAGNPEEARKLCEKLDYELAIIAGTGFVDYFLIVWDFIDWARRREIPVGPGRGSGAGCMVAYVLKITDIEPIRFGLLFERMLNLERVSPPDFDVDFCMRRRDEVVGYVRDKYGAESVANIITFGTFGAKMVVRDLARVQNVEYAAADRIAKMVPDDLNISLADALEKSSELMQETRQNSVAGEIVRQGRVIEGMVRNTGKHACGVIIGDQPITNLVPVTLQEGDLTTQYPKGPVEDLGLLKMDFLGLKTLTVISDAQENVRRTNGPADFDIEKIPLSDQKTFDLLNRGQTTGVFQLESGGMQSLCRQIGLSSFEEIIALIALYRPGPMQFIPQFIKGKRDPATIEVPHPLLKDLVEETYGVLVYQEQVMESARIIAGYTLGEADILRRAMGKKIAKVMEQQKEVFVAGAKKTHDMDKGTALEIFGILEKFAQYGFNKSHSAAYAMLSYRTGFLKANYPVQFMAALLSADLGNSDKLRHFIGECRSMGIEVVGPNVNGSRENFTPVINEDGESGKILFGLAAIKGVGGGPAEAILEEREANGDFEDLEDFIARVEGKAVNRRVMECLIKSGAFDFTGTNRGLLLADLGPAMSRAAEAKRDREAGQASFFDVLGDAASGSANGAVREDSLQDSTDGDEGQQNAKEAFSLPEMLRHEKELLGFYISGHPLDDYAGLVEALNSHPEEKLLTLTDRTTFRLCGVISKLTKKLSRKDNRPWAIVGLTTREGDFEVNVYSRAYEDVKDALVEERAVVITGTIMARDQEDPRLVGQEVVPLPSMVESEIKAITWVLYPGEKADDFIPRLRATAEARFGDVRQQIAFLVGDNQIVLAEIANSLSWQIEPKEYQKLRRHSAVAGVLFEANPAQLPEPSWKKKKF
ncbi:MAG: DNA polymerase III subunit alpha [Opitutales bacterium]|nr:DNA polymerase III subunit alpha [Opitutales bacterium]